MDTKHPGTPESPTKCATCAHYMPTAYTFESSNSTSSGPGSANFTCTCQPGYDPVTPKELLLCSVHNLYIMNAQERLTRMIDRISYRGSDISKVSDAQIEAIRLIVSDLSNLGK